MSWFSSNKVKNALFFLWFIMPSVFLKLCYKEKFKKYILSRMENLSTPQIMNKWSTELKTQGEKEVKPSWKFLLRSVGPHALAFVNCRCSLGTTFFDWLLDSMLWLLSSLSILGKTWSDNLWEERFQTTLIRITTATGTWLEDFFFK